MSLHTDVLAPDNNTDANFRLWISAINTNITNFGWVQTADTGQINFSTVTRPTSTNTYQGYAIYKMGDSLQSTTAVFLRFDFGTGNVTDGPAIKFQVGIGGTDGAGNLTGNVAAQVLMVNGGQAGSASTFNCRSSGSSSAFRMNFWLGPGTFSLGWTLAIERDKDSAGADTSFGVNIVWEYANLNGGQTSLGSQVLALDGSLGPVDNGGWYAMVSANSSQTGGGNTGVGPIRCALGPMRNPMLGLLLTARTDYTNESQNTVSIYGANHTYLMVRPATVAVNMNRWNTDCGLALLWE